MVRASDSIVANSMIVLSLRRLQALALAVGLIVSLQPSYIHPDEQFQSLEVLAVRFFGIKGTIPWEFQSETAARSFVPLLLNYGPLYGFLRIFKIERPRTILSLVRIQNYLTFIFASRWAFKRLSGTGGFSMEWCNFFIATSYLTGCFQSHSFSNSFETIVLLIVLVLYNELLPHVRTQKTPIYRIACLLGFSIVLGTFNRITFPAFILFPSLLVSWQFFKTHRGPLVLLLVVSVVSSLGFILVDTKVYQSSEFTIAPLKNLLYNFDESNLQIHGLHPRYQHILINLPQIIGPGILLLNPRRLNLKNSTKALLISAIASGLLFLSIFKHQELRFLLPLAPLLFACLDPTHPISFINSRLVLKLWLAFNLVLGTIYGVYHQSGVIKVLDRFYEQNEPIDVHVWWKAYSPPTWMYMNENLTVSTTTISHEIETVDQVTFKIIHNHVVDLKGCDDDLLNSTLHSFLTNGANVKLIAPNSLSRRLRSLQHDGLLTLAITDRVSGHLDLDHLDFDDFSTFQPVISVYNVTLTE